MRKQFLTVLLPMLVMVLIAASAQTQGAGTDALEARRTAEGKRRAHRRRRQRGDQGPRHCETAAEHAGQSGPHRGRSAEYGSRHRAWSDQRQRRRREGRTPRHGWPEHSHLSHRGRSDPGVPARTGSWQRQFAGPEAVHQASGGQSGAARSKGTARRLAKNEVAVAPPAAQSVAPATEAKLIQTSARATDFAFIEPSYRPKDSAASDDVKPAVVDPSARATAAAGKFAVRPEGSLLPPASAAMQSSGMQPAVNMAAEQKVQAAQAPAITGPKYTGEPISVNLKDVDLKDFFRLIHEISGLNVVLDPNVKGTLTIVLDDVPWDQALDIVLKNNDLSRQLEGNVLRIATVETMRKEAESRRAQIEAEALAVDKVTVTRFLSYAHSKDVVPTVKNFLTQRGDVISDDRTNALIIQDIPSVMPAIDRLLTQLDRKTQEVEIEARVVAATRSFARDIGTQLGFGWGDGKTAIGGASAVGTSPTTVGGLTPGYITAGSGHRGKPDSIVLELSRYQPDQRSYLRQCQQQCAHRCHPHHGGVARAAEDSFPSASGHAEQHSGSGSPGRARTHRDPGAVGWTAHRHLRGRVPALDGGSPDHVGRHHLPERGCGKHHS